MTRFTDYAAAKAYAQAVADELGMDVGVEAPTEYCRPGVTRLPLHLRTFDVVLLPAPEKRRGYELRCEVVRPKGVIMPTNLQVAK